MGALSETDRLATIYSETARAYAASWAPVIRPAGQRLLAHVPWSGVKRVVDIGTGAGTHLADVRRLAPDACVLGVDRAPGMLQLARVHGVPVAVMDGMALALRDEAFDVALMIFMLFHMPEPVAALREVGRTLRPGGTLGCVTWAEDPDVEASRIWEAELDALGAYDPAPIPRRHNQMNSPGKMQALLTASGLAPDRTWLEHLEHCWDLDGLVALHTGFGRARRKLETLDPPARAAFLARMPARLASLPSEAFVYRATAVCSLAARP